MKKTEKLVYFQNCSDILSISNFKYITSFFQHYRHSPLMRQQVLLRITMHKPLKIWGWKTKTQKTWKHKTQKTWKHRIQKTWKHRIQKTWKHKTQKTWKQKTLKIQKPKIDLLILSSLACLPALI